MAVCHELPVGWHQLAAEERGFEAWDHPRTCIAPLQMVCQPFISFSAGFQEETPAPRNSIHHLG